MLINKKTNDAINRQIGNELGASNQYLQIAAYFEGEALPQLAGFFHRQSDEERAHALRLAKYVVEAGGQLAIPEVAAPKPSFRSAEEAVKLSLDWEMEVTRQINKLLEGAKKDSDYLTDRMLQWFVSEQLEEVSSMDALLKVIQRAGESGLLRVEEYIVRRAGAKPVASEAAE